MLEYRQKEKKIRYNITLILIKIINRQASHFSTLSSW